MRHSFEEELSRLGDGLKMDEIKKRQLKDNMMKYATTYQKKRRIAIIPTLATIFFLCFAMIGTYFLVNKQDVITDVVTAEQLQHVSQTEDTFLLEWLDDSMDRGNHDLNTNVHGKLVVSSNLSDIQRGAIIYFDLPTGVPSIARIVGLPGETVEIKEGQVFINDRKLNTFYGKALNRGLTEEQYFEEMSPENMENEGTWREYFRTSMSPIQVEEGTYFVLVDNWWRGIDSRTFGLLGEERIQGIVLGYE